MAYPVSSRWLKFFRRGFTPITVVDVRMPGEGVIFAGLPVSDGSLSMSMEQNYRASGSVSVPDPELFPFFDDDSPVAPYGAELVIRTGILYPEGHLAYSRGAPIGELEEDGSAELIPMGVFPIEEVSASEASGNILNISFFDRAKLFENTDRESPQSFTGLLQAALESVIMDANPFFADNVEWSLNIDPTLPNPTLPRGTVFEGDRWNFVKELCDSIGGEVFFYRDGNIYVRDLPTISAFNLPSGDDIHWRFDATEFGNLIDVSRGVSRDGIYNGVRVVGSADSDRSPPQFLARDLNPNSRTFWNGPFGRSILKIDDANITSTPQAERVALKELERVTAIQRSVTFEGVGNPAIDPGDIVELVGFSGVKEVYLIEGYNYEFATAKLSATTKSAQFVEES